MNTNKKQSLSTTAIKDGLYIGIMSGTSLDGVDLVLCQFCPLTLVASHTVTFDELLRQTLLALCSPDGVRELVAVDNVAIDSKGGGTIKNNHSNKANANNQFKDDHLNNVSLKLDSVKLNNVRLSSIKLNNAKLGNASLDNIKQDNFSELDFFGQASVQYATLCVQAVGELLQRANKKPSDVIAIGVHGQTVRHRPNLGFSLQLIDPNVLSEQTGICVVSDFRRRDMAVGGQGAPLVPAFHKAIAQHGVVLNLGGIANITVLDDPIIGYDTGVANLLMDAWVFRHLKKPFDKAGAWASTGLVCPMLLDKLLCHPFLAQNPPKSTGREVFNLAWLDDILKSLPPIAPKDVQATLCEFTAKTVADAINRHDVTQKFLYVCGGGAYNGYLLTRLQAYLPHWQIVTTSVLGIDPIWVEAMCFAWLARQHLLGQPANLPSVTGASRAVVLGVMSPA